MGYLVLFLEFFKTGLFAIGGGLATLPFLYDLADKYPWFTRADLSNMIAVSESTPGPIGVNCATYAGFNAYGVWGGIVSTLGLVMPSIIVILIIAKILDKFKSNKFVQYGFEGIRPAVTAMIAVAFVDVAKETFLSLENFDSLKNIAEWVNFPALILFAVLFFATNKFKKVHPIVFIGIAAAVGVVMGF